MSKDCSRPAILKDVSGRIRGYNRRPHFSLRSAGSALTAEDPIPTSFDSRAQLDRKKIDRTDRSERWYLPRAVETRRGRVISIYRNRSRGEPRIEWLRQQRQEVCRSENVKEDVTEAIGIASFIRRPSAAAIALTSCRILCASACCRHCQSCLKRAQVAESR